MKITSKNDEGTVLSVESQETSTNLCRRLRRNISYSIMWLIFAFAHNFLLLLKSKIKQLKKSLLKAIRNGMKYEFFLIFCVLEDILDFWMESRWLQTFGIKSANNVEALNKSLGLLTHWKKPISYVFSKCLYWSRRGFPWVLIEHLMTSDTINHIAKHQIRSMQNFQSIDVLQDANVSPEHPPRSLGGHSWFLRED